MSSSVSASSGEVEGVKPPSSFRSAVSLGCRTPPWRLRVSIMGGAIDSSSSMSLSPGPSSRGGPLDSLDGAIPGLVPDIFCCTAVVRAVGLTGWFARAVLVDAKLLFVFIHDGGCCVRVNGLNTGRGIGDPPRPGGTTNVDGAKTASMSPKGRGGGALGVGAVGAGVLQTVVPRLSDGTEVAFGVPKMTLVALTLGFAIAADVSCSSEITAGTKPTGSSAVDRVGFFLLLLFLIIVFSFFLMSCHSNKLGMTAQMDANVSALVRALGLSFPAAFSFSSAVAALAFSSRFPGKRSAWECWSARCAFEAHTSASSADASAWSLAVAFSFAISKFPTIPPTLILGSGIIFSVDVICVVIRSCFLLIIRIDALIVAIVGFLIVGSVTRA